MSLTAQPRSRSGRLGPRLPSPQTILSWMYSGRLIIATAIFLAALWVWRDAPPAATRSATLILVAASGWTALSFWYSHGLRRPLSDRFLFGQVVFDVVLITWIVHLTGGANSTFAPLYILAIFGAAILLPFLGGVLIGVLASVLYFADVVLDVHSEISAATLLQIALFTTVALVTGYLGDRLRQTGAALGAMETELYQLRLDTTDILAGISTGVLTVDGSGRLLYLNTAAAELLSMDPLEWLGQPVLAHLESIAPGLGTVISRSAEARKPIRRFETDGGEGAFVLGVSTTLMERPDSDRPPVTAIFQDITEKVRLEALRRRAERLEAVAELSASLAHEIKNPLASIRSAVEQLSGGRPDPTDRQLLERLVLREADRLSRLLSEFIDFARVKMIAPEPVVLTDVVRHALELVRSHPDGHGRAVRLDIAAPDGALLVRGSEDLLHRAVFNLLLNAVQWAGAGGRVDLLVERVSTDLLFPAMGVTDSIRVRVADTGPGIPEETAEHVFDPFFTRRPGGTGLGLALVQRAVEAHGGAIFVENGRGADAGAVFTLYLPALERVVDTITPLEVASS
jgi:two-component system, NtrC family, sensor histidine kinase PilS